LAGGVCVGFPTFLVLRLISRAVRMNSTLADRLSGRWHWWIRGDGDGLRLAVGDVGARHIPPGWHGPTHIGTGCLLLVARAPPRTAWAWDRGTSPMSRCRPTERKRWSGRRH